MHLLPPMLLSPLAALLLLAQLPLALSPPLLPSCHYHRCCCHPGSVQPSSACQPSGAPFCPRRRMPPAGSPFTRMARVIGGSFAHWKAKVDAALGRAAAPNDASTGKTWRWQGTPASPMQRNH